MNAKKISGITLLSISLFLFFAGTSLFGRGLSRFVIGTFGVFGFAIFLILALVGIALIINARYQFSWKFTVYVLVLAFCVCSIFHLSFTFDLVELSYGSYLKQVYGRVTPGGLILSLACWPLQYLVLPVGAYVVLILVMAIMIAFIIDYSHARKSFKKLSNLSIPRNYNDEKNKVAYKSDNLGLTMGGFYDAKLKEGVMHQPTAKEANIVEDAYRPKQIISESKNEEKTLSAREEALIKLGFGKSNLEKKEDKISPEELAEKLSRSQPQSIELTPKSAISIPDFETAKKAALEMMRFEDKSEKVEASFVGNVGDNDTFHSQTKNENVINDVKESFLNSNFSIRNEATIAPQGIENKPVENDSINVKPVQKEEIKAEFNQENLQIDSEINVANFAESQLTKTEQTPIYSSEISDENIDKIIKEIQLENPQLIEDVKETSSNISFEDEFEKFVEKEIEANNIIDQQKLAQDLVEKEESELVKNFKQNFAIKKEKPTQQSFLNAEKEEKKNNKPTFTAPSNYNKPSIEILKTYEQVDDFDDEELKFKAELLEETLNNFKVPVNVVAITKGPAVTRFELQVQQGITVKKILQFSNDIAMALEAKGGIRIEAPIPGKNAVGIEVPNNTIQTIGLKEIISSPEFKKSGPLCVALGKDISGSTILCNIKEMPHLLVAGSTGSGKSVCLSVILTSLLYKLGPDDLKLILIDPKRVEFSAFNGIPHMLLPEAITEPKDAISALTWATNEMDRRFCLFHELRVNKIDDYNSREEVLSGKEPKLPTIVIVIDELADLIMTAKRDVEEKIRRISQLARAAGIHLIVATQRPSVDVITGTIKANLPSRIAFMVSSGPDSKTILDQYGAENLLGKGDMLYSPSNYSEPRRVQCAFVSGSEVRDVVDNIKENNSCNFDESIQKEIFKKDEEPVINSSNVEESKADFDPILPDALKLAIETRQASVSMIQRRFAVGYSRAARIIDQMELMKFVSPSDGSKARSVYITMDEYNAIFGDEN